jgi:hypothetical protein
MAVAKDIVRWLETAKAGSGQAGWIDAKRTLAGKFDLTICKMRVPFLGTFAISCYALVPFQLCATELCHGTAGRCTATAKRRTLPPRVGSALALAGLEISGRN